MLDENEYEKMIKDICAKIKPKVNMLDISYVQQDKFDLNKPVLQFQDSDGVIENICNVNNLEDGLDVIKQIFKNSNLEHRLHYFRVVGYDNYHWIDYGSHYSFFRVTKKV
ncbi:hypothetical protein [Staphylococcus phage PT94]